jgi:hypothetical protein
MPLDPPHGLERYHDQKEGDEVAGAEARQESEHLGDVAEGEEPGEQGDGDDDGREDAEA